MVWIAHAVAPGENTQQEKWIYSYVNCEGAVTNWSSLASQKKKMNTPAAPKSIASFE